MDEALKPDRPSPRVVVFSSATKKQFYILIEKDVFCEVPCLSTTLFVAFASYKSFIPDFLQGRPRSVIIHSLERRSKSLKYTLEDVSTADEEGTFTVKESNDTAHTVSFGTKSDNPTPSCTCRGWVERHIPCKHFWAVFIFYPTWNWERLPDSYKASAYLSSDASALDDFFNDSPSNSDSQLQDNSLTDENLISVQDEIPKQQVHVYYIICN